MSQENVELVREGFTRWNEGDYDSFSVSPRLRSSFSLALGALTASRTEVEAFEGLLYTGEPFAHSLVPSGVC